MDKFSYRLIPLTLVLIVVGVIGYITDSHLPEHLDWIAWSLAVVIYIFFTLMRERLIQRLRRHVYKDTLTGLDNRRYLSLRMNHEILGLKDSESYISFLMIDIDNFKSINDTYGHITGDKVLKQMASIFKQYIRINDTVARWGGEEFAVILPDTDSEGALKIAERIRSAVEGYKFYCEGAPRTITVSIGVVTTGEASDAESIVNMADRALYKAKEKRNLVCAA